MSTRPSSSARSRRSRRPIIPSSDGLHSSDLCRQQRLTRTRREATAEKLNAIGCQVASETAVEKEQAQLHRRNRKRRKPALPCAEEPCAQLIDAPSQCIGSCRLAWRAYRLELLPQALELLDECDELNFLTLASPHWKRPIGKLDSVSPIAMKQWVRRRLSSLERTDIITIGGIEASVNVELDGTALWAPHVHLVVSGASIDELKEAFSTRRFARLKSKGERPLHIVPVKDLGPQLGYCVKGHAIERPAFTGLNGRQHRKTNRLRASLLPEHDAWLASSTIGDRLILIGMRWYPNQHVLRRS